MRAARRKTISGREGDFRGDALVSGGLAGARGVQVRRAARPGVSRGRGVRAAARVRAALDQRVKWTKVVANTGLAGLRFHDLRHAGNIWASKAGTSTKDLMARMGHDDLRAALIYQRATSDADERIADRLSELVDKHRQGMEEFTSDDDGPADESISRSETPRSGGDGL